jgi:probable O-glycosylation ligase (exosortase A-associated)
MPLRDIVLTLFVFGMIPAMFRHPEWGVLMWTWIGLMNPHRLTWGFAKDFPFATLVGGVAILALLMSKEKKRVPWDPPVVLLALFILWMVVSTVFSLFPTLAWPQLLKIAKIQLFIFITLAAMQTKDRVIGLVWVSTLSLGYYGFKGGIYTLEGNSGYVLGPDGGFISGNTEISLALTMTIPLMRWLQLQTHKRWIKWALGLTMALTAAAILGSYSRGGLLAIVGMGAFLWAKSRKKAMLSMMLIALIPVGLAVMPDKWYDKMATISEYKQDSSAMGRINAWHFAFNLAKSRPLTGGGFWAFEPQAFIIWAPNPADVHHAHSIWFQVLGEHGFVGLGLYILIWIATWQVARKVIALARSREDFHWAGDLARMIQVALVGYFVGGSFLGLANWDYPYLLMVILVLTRVVLEKELGIGRAGAKRPGSLSPSVVATGRGAHVNAASRRLTP